MTYAAMCRVLGGFPHQEVTFQAIISENSYLFYGDAKRVLEYILEYAANDFYCRKRFPVVEIEDPTVLQKLEWEGFEVVYKGVLEDAPRYEVKW